MYNIAQTTCRRIVPRGRVVNSADGELGEGQWYGYGAGDD